MSNYNQAFMPMSPYPEHTKQTRCNNNLNNQNNRNDFFRPMISNPSIPMSYNHEHYYFDNNTNINNLFDIERNSISTRNVTVDSRKSAVQNSFQNDYYMSNYNTINNTMNNIGNTMNIDDMNLTRNPVNTRRDQLEKERNNEKNEFRQIQGGYMNENFTDFRVTNTRKGRNDINSSSYVPMARTLAIPKENI